MRGRKIAVTLDANSLRNAVKEAQSYKRYLQGKIQELLDRLAEEGFVVATMKFLPENTWYDGELGEVDVRRPEKRGEYTRAIVATGRTVLFIEFGTGISYASNHPEAAEAGMTRGSYSKDGKAKRRWEYYGETGTHGKVVGSRKRGDLILTFGNPANMPMYQARESVRERFAEIAREVFND